MVSLTRDQFAANLRRELYHAGMTQADLALASGMDRARVSDYATGKRLPSLNNLLRLSDGLGCMVGDLLEIEP